MTARELGDLAARLSAAERTLEQIAKDVRTLLLRDASANGSRRTLVAIASGAGGIVGAVVSVFADRLGMPRA